MKILKALFCLSLLVGTASAQLWSGLVASSRAMDWTGVGVVGGIPSGSWTRCTTGTGTSILPFTSTAAQINTAISGCDANHYVELGPGTFSLSTGLLWNAKSNVAVRGQGSDTTLLNFSGHQSCSGGPTASVCFMSTDGNYFGSPSNLANWTAGYSQGGNVLTLSSVTNLKVGSIVTLDQLDDVCGVITAGHCAGDNNAVFICYTPLGQCSTNGDNGGAPRAGRSQQQLVTIASCDGNSTPGHACTTLANVTISPALRMSNWSGGKTPQAWWATSPVMMVGIEDVSINSVSAGSNHSITFFNCLNCWARGVRSIGPTGRSHIIAWQSAHITIQDSYLFKTNDNASVNYGIESLPASDMLVQNVIFQQIQAPYPANGTCTGCVYAYNFDVNNVFNNGGLFNFQNQSGFPHAVGDDFILYEGNIGAGIYSDNFHGTHHLQTIFRNYWNGYQKDEGSFVSSGQGTTTINLGAFSRFYNILGNVLGNCALYSTYENAVGNAHAGPAIYDIGFGNAIPNDSNTVSTLLRWGNYDCVTNTNRFVAGEVPSGLGGSQASFANPVPACADTTCFATFKSFYLNSRPSWWTNGKAWPSIGPDVTGGNLKYCTGGSQTGTYVVSAGQCPGGSVATLAGGRIITNPAMDCYLNTMNGPPDGTGTVLNFNPLNCYSAAVTTTATFTPTPLAFGTQAVGTTSPTLTATLTNSGSNVLQLDCGGCGFGLSGSSFTFVGTSCGTSLAPAQTCNVQVTFSPISVGAATGSLIATNSATNSPQTISLTGTGVTLVQGQSGCLGNCTVIGSMTVGAASAGATLTGISVTPLSLISSLSVPITYTATGTFSDGSTADITAQANWSMAPPGIATNSDPNNPNVVTCIAGGFVSVTAGLAAVMGSAPLTCQSIQISPSGNLPQAFQNTPYSLQFTAIGGTGPFTFTSVDLPSWASMTPGGLLTGTPLVLNNYAFHVTLTDSLANTTGSVAMTINVVVQPAEDNRYCNSSEVVIGLSVDGPAQPLQNCNYTALAGSPTAIAPTIFVCPASQNLSDGVTPNVLCVAGAPPYYNTIQAALNAADCGDWIAIFPNNYIGGTKPQNIYDESLVLPPTTCFGDIRGWIWVTTASYTFLPSPGTRINPSWVGLNSIPGRPSYPQSGQTIPRLPFIRCHDTGNECAGLKTPASSAGASGWRFIGLEFAGPHGRESVCPNNFNGTPQCTPGWTSPMVSIGCSQYSKSTCGTTGASHIILDRVIVHACDDKTDTLCKDQALAGVEMQGGRHLSLIDSYIYGFKTLGDNHVAIGPSVDSQGVIGGNPRNTTDDIGNKIVNNFIEASSENFFLGGGAATTGIYPYDTEFRRNHLWKPLLWKINDPSFPQFGGSIFDLWVGTKGSGYAIGAACTIDPPTGPNPVQATCHSVVVGGQVVDAFVDVPGSGYIEQAKITIAGGDGKAKVLPVVGILNIKNMFELKHGRRVLVEGNVAEQCWKGQSDQDCNVFLLTPKNADNTCETCTVQDMTMRYNLFRKTYRGGFIGTDVATRCQSGNVCLPDVVRGISIHDDVIETNPEQWLAKSSAYDGAGGTIFGLNNANPQAKSVQDVTYNHVTGITSEPTSGRSASVASFLTVGQNCKQTSAVLGGIVIKNSIAAGGVKDTATIGAGCYQCQGPGCGPTETAMRGTLASDNLLPLGGGNYTGGQVMAGVVDVPGTCTVAPTSCTFTGGGFTVQAACGFRFAGGSVTAVFPNTVGSRYASAPAVVFAGQTCSVTPTAHTSIGGTGIAQNKAWCFNNNLNPTAAFPGEVSMSPYPTAQGDPVNNACSSHGGGGNLTVTDWAHVGFVNFVTDGTGQEVPTGDLHLANGTPGKGTADDGLDMGANIDLVLGTSGGTPSQYTGCSIQGGLVVCPP